MSSTSSSSGFSKFDFILFVLWCIGSEIVDVMQDSVFITHTVFVNTYHQQIRRSSLPSRPLACPSVCIAQTLAWFNICYYVSNVFWCRAFRLYCFECVNFQPVFFGPVLFYISHHSHYYHGVCWYDLKLVTCLTSWYRRIALAAWHAHV